MALQVAISCTCLLAVVGLIGLILKHRAEILARADTHFDVSAMLANAMRDQNQQANNNEAEDDDRDGDQEDLPETNQ